MCAGIYRNQRNLSLHNQPDGVLLDQTESLENRGQAKSLQRGDNPGQPVNKSIRICRTQDGKERNLTV